jgi:hypothetical protein
MTGDRPQGAVTSGAMKPPEHSRDVTLTIAKLATLFCCCGVALYAVSEAEPFPAVGMFLWAAPLWAVILWLQKDARRTGVGAVHDWGYFLVLGWPFVIPWYVFRSRGRAGWRLLLGLFALIAAPSFVGVAVQWVVDLLRSRAA